jgi:hypothetical protein
MHGVHVSVLSEDTDASALKNPIPHWLHSGCAMLDPISAVKKPARHLVWGVHASVCVVDTDTSALNSPALHSVQVGCEVRVPATSTYSPLPQGL